MERAAWERIVDGDMKESTAYYRYFCEYRDTPVEKRDVAEIAKKFGKPVKTMKTICANYHWRKRAEKYDDFVDKEARRLGLIKAERIRLSSLTLSERMLKLAEEKIEDMSFKDLTARETREYIKAAVALAEVFKDDNSKQREYLDAEDSSADVVIYLPEVDYDENEGGD